MKRFVATAIGLLLTSLTSIAQTADVAAPGTAPTPPAWMQFVPFVIIIGVFYFFLIRPQAKKQKETQSFLTALKVGDQVITQSGILGRITAMTDTITTLEVANNVQMKFLKTQVLTSQAILQVAKKEGQ